MNNLYEIKDIAFKLQKLKNNNSSKFYELKGMIESILLENKKHN